MWETDGPSEEEESEADVDSCDINENECQKSSDSLDSGWDTDLETEGANI